MEKSIKISALHDANIFLKDKKNYIAKLLEKYGDVNKVECKIFGATVLKAHLIASPVYIKHILFDNTPNYIKTPFAYKNVIKTVGADALLTTNNYEHWKHERAYLNPVFTEENVKNYANIISNNVCRLLNKWEEFSVNHEAINIGNEITAITFSNLQKTLFGGIDLNYDEIRYILQRMDELMLSSGRFFGIFPNPINMYQLKKSLNQTQLLSNTVVNECLSPKVDQDNIIKKLYDLFKKQNKSEDQIRNLLNAEALVFMSAGHQTVSALLVWTLVYLSLNPIHFKRLREEIKNVVGDRLPGSEDLPHLIYTKAILQETLRLQPIFPLLLRTALHDDAIGQHQIKKGEVIFISIYHIHRILAYWPNPEGFDPERFLKPLDERHKFIYLPFMIGQRSCIGQHFAMMQAMLILANITQKYQLYLTSSSTLQVNPNSTMNKLNDDVKMIVQKIE